MCEWDGETYRWSGTYGHLILFTSACCIITISFIAVYMSLWAEGLALKRLTMEVLARLLTSMEVLPRVSRFGLIVPKVNYKSNF